MNTSCGAAFATPARPPSSEHRVAITVAGDVRSFLAARWSFEQFLLWPNRGLLDVFWHVWANTSLPLHHETLAVMRALPGTR